MSPASLTISNKWVLPIAILVFLVPVAFIEAQVMVQTDGTFIYPVDDTFIHLAIAKNLAFHGVWGISAHEFSSASSSVLYPLILASILKLVGLYTTIPLVVNLIVAIVLLYAVKRWLSRQAISPINQLFILVGLIFFTPLPVLAMSGMEHTLQLLFCFLFIYSFSDSLERSIASGEKDWRLPWPVYVYGFLVTATRYEGMTLVIIACGILLFHRKFSLAVKLGLIAFLPVLVFGVIALSKGSYFMPNSVLIKSGAPPLTVEGIVSYFTDGLYNKLSSSGVGYNMIATQRLLFILPITYLIFMEQTRQAIAYRYILIILTALSFMHLAVAGIVRFPRYEAYLMGCSSVVIGTLIVRYGREVLKGRIGRARWVALGLALLLIFPAFLRSTSAFDKVGTMSVNIFDQQYQMGSFLHKYYNDTPVAFNDIGAPSLLTQGKNVDLWGLGNIDVTRSIKGYYYGTDFLSSLTKRDSVKIAIVFQRYFPSALLHQWSKVGSWQVPNNVICADDSVSFYAVDKGSEADLKRNLHDYQRLLPEGVTARYY